VWKATWRKVTVAVKLLLVHLATPEVCFTHYLHPLAPSRRFIYKKKAIRRLEREINTAARLRHPHVVQMYGACVISTTELWLVMEFADGGSLFSRLADKQLVRGRGRDKKEETGWLGVNTCL
jgi:serine/threonine protein kinase